MHRQSLRSPPPPPTSLAQQQQQQLRVSPSVMRSASRQQGGLDHWYGLSSRLAVPNDISVGNADQSPPHMPAPDLLSRPSGELVTPDTYGQACLDEHSALWLHFG